MVSFERRQAAPGRPAVVCACRRALRPMACRRASPAGESRTAWAGPHSQPAAPSTKSADDMAGVVRTPVPTAPEPKPAPATEDRRGQTASVDQPIPAEEPPKPAPSQPVVVEKWTEQPAAPERPATAAEPAKPAPAPSLTENARKEGSTGGPAVASV